MTHNGDVRNNTDKNLNMRFIVLMSVRLFASANLCCLSDRPQNYEIAVEYGTVAEKFKGDVPEIVAYTQSRCIIWLAICSFHASIDAGGFTSSMLVTASTSGLTMNGVSVSP